LQQTYRDFEVLIMDDCSPDNTPEVSQSFGDPRIRYIRNEPNLGHLRNYNKGISLSRGEYVWLISADDLLRRPDALERYVALMQSHPGVGFVCCSAVEIVGGKETAVAKYSVQAGRDTVFQGHDFLRRLLYSNSVVAASVLVRKSFYSQLGAFPLDLPYAGDWYLWCLFSLHGDVGYCAEPLVAYRIHELSMTESLITENVHICADDDLAVLWRVEREARNSGNGAMARRCGRAIAYAYARQLIGTSYRVRAFRISRPECEDLVYRSSSTPGEARWLLARVFESAGDMQFQERNLSSAFDWYQSALRLSVGSPRVWAKVVLLKAGALGNLLRRRASQSRG
jgi:glycosyltransferase involved in cell wall biosynthesis